MPGQSDLLAPWTYFSPEFYALEVEHLFKPAWLLVGHISDFKKTGDYLTFNAFNERAVIIKNESGEINAFHNVCRHRGGRVVEHASGNCPKALSCPFHGWSYSLSGNLMGVPLIHTFPELNKSDVKLPPIDLEIWMGFVFIRFGSGQSTEKQNSLSEQMSPIVEQIKPYLPEQLIPLAPPSVDVKAFNWKVIHDIDNEGYHVPVGHPSLNQLYGHDYRDYSEHGFSMAAGTVADKPAKAWSVRHYQKLLPEFAHLDKELQRRWFYVMHFPNLIFAFYPDMMELYMTIPDSPESTRYISRTYALPDARREVAAARYLNLRINQETADEDEKFVGWLQEGMKSSAWQAPTLSTKESGVREYHQKIQSILPVAKLRQVPLSGLIEETNRKMSDSSN